MKKLLQSTLVRVACQILVLAMIATLVPNGLTTKAYAQSGSALGADPAKKVGVLEFVNDSNKFGQIVSKNATSAFVMECNKTQKVFAVEASPEEVKQKMEEMGIRQPASKLDCIALASEMELDGMVQGFIKSISVKGQGSNKVATANVVIQYIDRASGEILMGTNAKGESSARIGFVADEDTLVVEAISKAINIAVFNLSNYNIPKATIHANEGEEGVILNAGSRSNLYPGLRMVVMRGAYPVQDENLEDSTIVSEMRVVGYIEVTSVTGIDATARIIKQNVGVKPEDVCLGLYSDVYVSKYSPVEETQNNVNSKRGQQIAKAKNSATNLGYIVLGVAAAVGLACLFSSKGGSGESGPDIETGDTPGEFVVKENKNGYITGSIIGLRILKDGGRSYVDLWNGEEGDMEATSGKYDGKKDVYINVFNYPEMKADEGSQASYTAQWIYVYTKLDVEGEGVKTIEYSDASGSAKWTPLSKPYDLEPSTTIDANNFEVGEAFVWTCDSISGDKCALQYKVELWDSSSSNKKTFYTSSKNLDAAALTEIWSYLSNIKYEKKTFVWRVGVQNTLDSNSKAYNWSDYQTFTVDSLPPAPPTKGMKRTR